MSSQLEETTIRDFGGGWNVSDSDKALGPRYQPVSDNMVRGTDGHMRKRYGYQLFGDFKDGVETAVPSASYTVGTTNATNVVTITKTAHGYANGDHFTITSFSSTLNGITPEMMEKVHGILVVDVDNFKIYVRGTATSTGSASRTIVAVHDTHTLAGNDIFGRYYRDRLFVFTDNGEIGTVDINGAVAAVWNYAIANALTLEPWTQCERISAEVVRGKLIAVNGALNDKPLSIVNTTVNYLVDASTLSNGAIPRADFVIAASQYLILVNTEYGSTMLEIGAKNTVMTCSREVNPSDAVEVDVGMLTQAVDSTILGAAVLRSRVFLGLSNMSLLGTLGIYTDIGGNSVHEPDFNDNVSQFGTFAHHSIVSLGNDLYCAGINGVNSLELSRASGEFTPVTISDLINPVMLRHFTRLTEDDRRYKVFAVWDVTNRTYMLFAPKHSAGASTLEEDAIYVTTTLQQFSLAYVRWPNHKVDAGDFITISGVTDYNVNLSGSVINGTRRVRHVVDENTVVVEVDAYVSGMNVSFGGLAISVEPVNDETIGYIYESNPSLKIKRWTRFRNLDFRWGAVSQFNRLFFGNNGKVFQFGDNNNPFSADEIGNYDYRSFTNSFSYVVGDRVRDTVNDKIYIARVAHTSPASGTFSDARDAALTIWEEYLGEEIAYEVETAWTDFKARKYNKQLELVSFDTEGTAEFEFSVFTDSIQHDFESQLLAPVRTTTFVAQDAPGFGGGDQPFGGGRNTRQEWLHSVPAHGKLFRFRWSGSSRHPLKISAATFYYHKSQALT